ARRAERALARADDVAHAEGRPREHRAAGGLGAGARRDLWSWRPQIRAAGVQPLGLPRGPQRRHGADHLVLGALPEPEGLCQLWLHRGRSSTQRGRRSQRSPGPGGAHLSWRRRASGAALHPGRRGHVARAPKGVRGARLADRVAGAQPGGDRHRPGVPQQRAARRGQRGEHARQPPAAVTSRRSRAARSKPCIPSRAARAAGDARCRGGPLRAAAPPAESLR
ncbi:unnamed protein product, partial [Prorocentrum cordatum]